MKTKSPCRHSTISIATMIPLWVLRANDTTSMIQHTDAMVTSNQQARNLEEDLDNNPVLHYSCKVLTCFSDRAL